MASVVAKLEFLIASDPAVAVTAADETVRPPDAIDGPGALPSRAQEGAGEAVAEVEDEGDNLRLTERPRWDARRGAPRRRRRRR